MADGEIIKLHYVWQVVAFIIKTNKWQVTGGRDIWTPTTTEWLADEAQEDLALAFISLSCTLARAFNRQLTRIAYMPIINSHFL